MAVLSPVFGLPKRAVEPPALNRLQSLILSYSPTLFFKCDEQSGSIVDYANRYSLSKTGSPTYRTGPLATGELGSINCPASAYFRGSTALDLGSVFTIGAILDITVTAEVAYFGDWNATGTMLYTSNGTNFRLYVGANPITYSSAPTGRHLWVGTFDGSTATLYRDGVSVASGSLTPVTSTSVWSINDYQNSLGRSGGFSISDAFAIQRSLSATQVKALYDASHII
jgi:hypothetical protein